MTARGPGPCCPPTGTTRPRPAPSRATRRAAASSAGTPETTSPPGDSRRAVVSPWAVLPPRLPGGGGVPGAAPPAGPAGPAPVRVATSHAAGRFAVAVSDPAGGGQVLV